MRVLYAVPTHIGPEWSFTQAVLTTYQLYSKRMPEVIPLPLLQSIGKEDGILTSKLHRGIRKFGLHLHSSYLAYL